MVKLTKSNILQNSEDISRTLKRKSTNSKYLAFYKHTNNLENARLGLAVPKKNAKRAIDRNRIKRLMREVYRQTMQKEALPEHIVLRLRKKIGDLTKNKLRESERIEIRTELSKLMK